jgi:transcriptional regulator with XRE-family HTH domain
MTVHWTERSIADYTAKLFYDFIDQLNLIDFKDFKAVAKKMGVTINRIQQILRGESYPTLPTIVKLIKAIDSDVAIIVYKKDKEIPPINPQIFVRCWEYMGKPIDFFALDYIISVGKKNE